MRGASPAGLTIGRILAAVGLIVCVPAGLYLISVALEAAAAVLARSATPWALAGSAPYRGPRAARHDLRALDAGIPYEARLLNRASGMLAPGQVPATARGRCLASTIGAR